MESRFFKVVLSAFIVTCLIGTTPAEPSIFQATLMEPNQATPEISTDDLKLILETGSAMVLDTRPFMEWAVSHIPGAEVVAPKPGLPRSQYTSDVAEVGRLVNEDRNASIVLYCNGPFCGKSKRVSADLIAAGYTNVRRYQLGVPVWRALGGLMQIEPAGITYVYRGDRTAVFVDARSPEEFRSNSIRRTRNVPLSEVLKAKDDGRLPYEDHNTRIVVFGRDGSQARAVAREIIKNAWHNVTFFDGSFEEMSDLLDKRPIRAIDLPTIP